MESVCIEPDCDRSAREGDARCPFHAERLGPRPLVSEDEVDVAPLPRPGPPPRQPGPRPVVSEDEVDAAPIAPVERPRPPPRQLADTGRALGLGILGTLSSCSMSMVTIQNTSRGQWMYTGGLGLTLLLATFAVMSLGYSASSAPTGQERVVAVLFGMFALLVLFLNGISFGEIR